MIAIRASKLFEENQLNDDPGVKNKTKRKGISPLKRLPKAFKPLNPRKLMSILLGNLKLRCWVSQVDDLQENQPASHQASVAYMSEKFIHLALHTSTIYTYSTSNV